MGGKIHKSYVLVNKLVLALFFVVPAMFVIFSAAGYRFDLRDKAIFQTAMIVVKALPKNTVLSINGQVHSSDNLWRVNNLTPGAYDIEVSKPGYNIWSNSVNIEAGQTALFEDVVLFLTQPVETVVDNNDEKTKFVRELTNQKINETLTNDQNEIVFEGNLVTRYSKEIFNAQLYSDNAHITFIADNEFHVIDIDGSNDFTLFKLKNDSKYLILNGGQNILCLDGEKLRMVKIR
jgi:hypothetical protein